MDVGHLESDVDVRCVSEGATAPAPAALGMTACLVAAHQSHYRAMSTSSAGLDYDAYVTEQRGRSAGTQSAVTQTQPLHGLMLGRSTMHSQIPSLMAPGHLTESSVMPYPTPLLPPSLSIPQSAQGSGNKDKYLEVVAHPAFEDVMRAVFIGRQIGEDQERQRLIADQHKRSMDSIHQARMEYQKSQEAGKSNAELDMLLRTYLKLIQGLNQELILTQSEANNACSMFEQQIRAITNNASQMEGPVALSATDEDHLRQVLKRKYSGQIRHLNEEFRRKRKKGKLPVNATDLLRQWWDNNLAWPYPSEDEKRGLADQTDLSATQINNWFINQRKRHWHKFFKDGRLPQSPEEATDILKQQGVLP